MDINESIEDSIDKQLRANERKNLFYNHLEYQSPFLPEVKDIIVNNKNELLLINDLQQSDGIVELMTRKAYRVFCKSNQYIDLRQDALDSLKEVYKILWQEIITYLKQETESLESIQKNHLERLQVWLLHTNAFVKEINDPYSPIIREVVCAEYSAQLQLELLQINPRNILDPLLDIGCGEHAWLVKYLRDQNVQAFGFDRLVDFSEDYIFNSNWFEFDFKPGCWGTIISNLSFALHFLNHNERTDGDFIAYGEKYMQILASLKNEGSFYYAPSLPFIEKFLPVDKFIVSIGKINEQFSFTRVQRIA